MKDAKLNTQHFTARSRGTGSRLRTSASLLTVSMVMAASAASAVSGSGSAINSATVSLPTGMIDPNLTTNSVTDTDVVTASSLMAAVDTITNVNGANGAPAAVNAFAGDTINGVPAGPANATLSLAPGATVPAGLTFDPVTGNVDVAAGTPAGTYAFDYQLCEKLNPANCRTATISVTVTAPAIAAANDDAGSVPGIAGGTNLFNVLANDTLNGVAVDPAKVALTVTAPASHAGVSLDPATGQLSVAPNTPAGTYAIGYTICEKLNPTNCSTATIAVVVGAAPIAASPDTPAAINGADGGKGIVNVFANDVLNGQPVDPAKVIATVTTPATPATPGALVPLLDPATGLVDVPAGTPAGTYTIAYQVCEALNPTNCATSSVTVVISPPAITAAADTPAAVRSGIGSANLVNAFANDTLNGAPVDLAAITARVTTPAANPGVTLDPATGLVSVAADVPAGTYTIAYEICEKLNPTNCSTGSVTVVVDPALSTVTGTVFTDSDGDNVLDPNEPRRAGWIVEVSRNGAVVATATTDTQGNYSIAGLLSGGGYEIAFRNPENNVVYDRITDLTLGANTVVVDQNEPIDPSGIFYDSVTRQPIAGVVARMTDANGVPLPVACFRDPSQASQTTGASGEYRFDIIPGAAAACPKGETVYRLVFTPPAGYSSTSSVLLPSPGPFDPTGMPSPVRINPEGTIPTTENPPFYIDFRLAAGDPDIINNHIALDPFLTRTPLVVTKTSPRRSASTGDLVPYQITVRNTENVRRAGVDVVDILPPGMKYVPGTASAANVPQEPVSANSNRELVWHGQVIPANGSVSYDLTLVVGAGVTGGQTVNTGVAENAADGAPISNRGTAAVTITPSAVFDCSELLGKVFEDRNRNGYQDEGEPGVPGARLATVNGQLVTTDEYGRYHIACAAVPDARIGSNFVLKLDPRTLPLGWDVTTDNPRSIRLTRGKFGELNFGVAPQEATDTAPGTTPANRTGKGE
jgi:uncharacterized repeat protein (TIGR01451 family)